MQAEQKAMKEAHEKEVEKYINEATLEEMKTSNYKEDLIKVPDELEQELKAKVESKWVLSLIYSAEEAYMLAYSQRGRNFVTRFSKKSTFIVRSSPA